MSSHDTQPDTSATGAAHELRLPALAIHQGDRTIYAFGVDGKKLHSFTTVSRIRRDDTASLHGYQRPEVLSHVRAIRRYLESDRAVLPNALVLAFDKRVTFEPATPAPGAYSVPGHLVIPVDEHLADHDKPALLVDGQQRSAAIRDADLPTFPVAAVGFIADDEKDQRDQFILVNSTKPLPRGLIHELLPHTGTDTRLPPAYAKRRLPAELMASMATDPAGPFCGRVDSPTSPSGTIKDNSLLRMIENSLTDGALYQYRDPATGMGDTTRMLLHLRSFWNIVAETFPTAWQLPPRESRLTHGVGIQALGFVMDALTDGSPVETTDWDAVRAALCHLRPIAAWTSGTWHFPDGEQRRWNGLQNNPSDVRRLTALLQHAIDGRTGAVAAQDIAATAN